MLPAARSGTVSVGDLSVNRMGFGAMRLTGEGIWGPPPTLPRPSACSIAPCASV